MIERVRLAAVVSMLAAACSFRASAGDGDPSDAAADAVDMRPVGRCGTPGAITQNFASDLARWRTGTAMVSQVAGELVVANGTITSKSHVDLISEQAGTVTFETSPDRGAWRLLGTRPTPGYAKAVRLVVGVVATTGPVPAHFAGVDRGGEAATWCKAEALVDTFTSIDVNPFGTRWNNTTKAGTSCTLGISGGTARSNQDGSGPADCWFGSSAAYDLRGSAVSTYITTISSFVAGWQTYLAIRDDSDRSAMIAFDNNEMCATGTGITRTCVGYASNDEYWRLREDAGMLRFEISTDNAAWQPVHAIPAPFAVDAVRIHVGTVADRPLGTSIGLSISDINP
jgi:hypothetical protein